MPETDKQNWISFLIAKEIFGEINQEEKIELEKWINHSPERKILYDKLKNDPNLPEYLQKYNKINTGTAWKILSAKLFPAGKNKIISMKILKYAAFLLIPLLVAGITFYLLNKPDHRFVQEQVEEIIPGNPKARIILADGQVFNLDNEKDFNFVEFDGTVIHKKENAVDYSIDSVKSETGILYNTIEVPHGGEYTIILSDGTTVYLNSISKLKYPVRFTGKYRMVELSGEAFFNVTHDSLSPFVVKINEAEIEVLGTSFNINAYEGASSQFITLEKGSIKIHSLKPKIGAVVLHPDQQAVIPQNSNVIEIRNVNASLFSAWRQGKIIFRDERLVDIMDNLARWYNIDIFYLNPSVKELRFGGSLNKYENITPILEVFALTNKVKYKINGTTILFYE